jgi:hypothetical protein
MKKLYWGDLHAHCGISYGTGSLENACLNAREHLDFVSIVGHALWPDIPEKKGRLAPVSEYHEKAFARLAENWPDVLRQLESFNAPGKFITIPGYEWHSMRYGDYVVFYPHTNGPIISAETPRELAVNVRDQQAILIPHHPAYVPFYRAMDWSAFPETAAPVVEIFSSHGCGEADDAPFPYFHAMGPRDSRTTARAGLAQGLRFGFAAATDNHAGYPGAWGCGVTGVFAEKLTRESIFAAIKERKTIAVTGDRIAMEFSVNDCPVGGAVKRGAGKIKLRGSVRGWHRIAGVEIIKNGRVWARPVLVPAGTHKRKLIRLEWGWGHDTGEYAWKGSFSIRGGNITDVHPCFGAERTWTTPKDERNTDEAALIRHRITGRTGADIHFESITVPNLSPRSSVTNALVLELEGGGDARIAVCMNGTEVSASLTELSSESRSFFCGEWLDPAFCLHRAVCAEEYDVCFELEDAGAASPSGADYYYLRMRQENGQYGWTSPVFVEN